MSSEPNQLRRADCLAIGAFCLILFGYSLPANRVLTGHECVIPECSREMLADHDWLIPKCGGFPWLERPPLSHWITIAALKLAGTVESNWAYRLAPTLLATLIALIVARFAAGWYGRPVGLLSGLMLASMWEYYSFATDPEADIFLCAVVTGAIALFIGLEFGTAAEEVAPDRRFLGRRPWPVLAFFVLLGATNLVKGLLFGTLMVLVPIGTFLLWNADLGRIRRYLWLWGWLAFLVVAGTWPVIAYLRCPEVVDIWYGDYVGRLNKGYIGEPAWYYLAALPGVMLPWTAPAVVGLLVIVRSAWRERFGPERFLFCWAVATPAFFSIPDGKHHHYLLQCLAPWAVLAAIGGVRVWQAMVQRPWWARYPLTTSVLTGLAVDAVLIGFRDRLPNRDSLLPLLLAGCPVLIFTLGWAITRPNGRVAIATLFSTVAVALCAGYSCQTRLNVGYRDDIEFLHRVSEVVPADRSLFVTFDPLYHLETFNLLFYGDRRARLLPLLSHLQATDIHDPEVYVTCRCRDAAELALYGTPELVLASEHTRWETSPADRRALFRLRFPPDLARKRVQQPWDWQGDEGALLPHTLHHYVFPTMTRLEAGKPISVP